MTQTSARHTLYALLTSLEEDLRRILHDSLSDELPAAEVLGESLWTKTTERLEAESARELHTDELLRRLPFLDFGDLIGILDRHRGRLSKEKARDLKQLSPLLQSVVPVRNRVMHTRPLEYDDLQRILTVRDSVLATKSLAWGKLSDVSEKLGRTPGWELGMTLPIPDSAESVGHNLPLPEFDETGFVGRQESISRVMAQCLGTFPIITIVGEGGVGKTALALKVAYELLDHEHLPFEAIVWTSAKAAALTPTEVQRIDGAIKDSTGLLRSAAVELAGSDGFEDAEEEILAYMQDFKILLILDNLETVLDEQVSRFLTRLPFGSKVLITSRIGLGELEFRVRLDPLDKSEAVDLLRAVATVRGVSDLIRMPNSQLAEYCAKMSFSPGHIKWFVSAVQAGSRPEEVLANPEVFLSFCLDNVYGYLSKDSRTVLDAILSVPGEHTQTELAYFTDMDVSGLQSALQELLRTNLLTLRSEPTGYSYSSRYALSDLAREYLQRQHPVEKSRIDQITRRRRQLVGLEESARAHAADNSYDPGRVSIRSRTDRVLAKYLLGALAAARRKEFDLAERSLERARQLGPGYFEVHRVEGYLRYSQENFTAARAAYEAAIDLEPGHAPLRNWYGSFLLKAFDDLEGALEQFQRADELDPGRPDNLIGLARTRLYLGNHRKARKLLRNVLTQADLHEKTRTVATDLFLQTFSREAGYRLENGDPKRALATLQELKREYAKLDPDQSDFRMRRGLRRPAQQAFECLRVVRSPTKKQQAKQLAVWFEDVSEEGLVKRKLEGRIERIIPQKSYGFILVSGGDSVFFHRADVLPQGLFWELRKGDPVIFSLRQEFNRRPRAIRVRRDEASKAPESQEVSSRS